MSKHLKISVGQHSDKGRKDLNQDFHSLCIPDGPQLTSKGIAIAIADGISSSNVSQIASETAVGGFLRDYYCTSDAWSVKTSGERVISAVNSWLYSETKQSQYSDNKDRGYVCTFSAMVFKSTTAHIFHAGDTRIYRLSGDALEQLTEDHRLQISQDKSYLRRALGMDPEVEIDYQNFQVDEGDTFILATDGIYEFISAVFMVETIKATQGHLDIAAKIILDKAYENGSTDNLTIQIVRVDQLPSQSEGELYLELTTKPFPPDLEPRMIFDGYEIIREVHSSSRSHIYLAVDQENKTQVIIKTPSVDLRGSSAYLEQFLMEEWVARRIKSAHVLKPCPQDRPRNFLYVVTEYIEGQTLAQWMIDNPKPNVETVRGIIEQIAKGLNAFHRLEMLHQDIRPNNIMIDKSGTVKIIDFGSTRVAGVLEITKPIERQDILGTAQYTAPEYYLGEGGTTRSDMFSVGVIAYQMLANRLPYGTQIAKSKTRAAQRKLRYRSVLDDDREIPAWIDGALKKAVRVDPLKRYEVLSEFIYDMRQPNKAFLNKTRGPLLERNPTLFWKSVALIMIVLNVILLSVILG
ncbi:MAG: protein kinase [Rhodospirillaceae bacterium]|nr:MAG: protein kinase [Rhodospirillaceae bacterium]